MKHVEYSWTTFDDIKIFAQSWRQDAVPKAVIALVHGLGEHSDRYTWLVKKLPEAGYALNAYDLRGHGRSAGPRVHAPSFEALMRDIDRHLENTRGALSRPARFSVRPQPRRRAGTVLRAAAVPLPSRGHRHQPPPCAGDSRLSRESCHSEAACPSHADHRHDSEDSVGEPLP